MTDKTYTTNLRRDASQAVITTSAGIVTQDATPSPQKSPLAITTTVTTLTLPSNAAEVVLKSDVAIRVSEEATAADHYWLQSAGVPTAYGMANTSTLYVRTDSGSGTLYFYFNTV